MTDKFDDNCECDDIVSLNFRYSDTLTGSTQTFNRVYDTDCLQWTEALRDFLQFLSGVYGYDIAKYISVSHREFRQD